MHFELQESNSSDAKGMVQVDSSDVQDELKQCIMNVSQSSLKYICEGLAAGRHHGINTKLPHSEMFLRQSSCESAMDTTILSQHLYILCHFVNYSH